MIASLAAALFKPFAAILGDDGDESPALPLTAWRDEDGRPLLDENNSIFLST